MPAPSLVKYVDSIVKNPLGKIWVNPSAPVTVASNAGFVPVLILDQTQMPEAFPNPWCIKWRITNVSVPYMDGLYDDSFVLEDATMELKIQLSTDYATWTDYKAWGITMEEGMVGRFQYKIDLPVVPRYLQVVAKIYPKRDATVTYVTVLMGMDNTGWTML
jgi:hypothetical protein